jgi:hypothetical protein
MTGFCWKVNGILMDIVGKRREKSVRERIGAAKEGTANTVG